MALPALIAGGVVAGSAIGKLINKPPQFNFDAGDIDKMISAFRTEGLEGIRSLGAQGQQDASARLAASGQNLSPAARQAAFMPIFENLSRARAELGSRLAQISGSLNFDVANKQFQSDMARFSQLDEMLNAISDVGGLSLLGGAGGGATGGLGITGGGTGGVGAGAGINLTGGNI